MSIKQELDQFSLEGISIKEEYNDFFVNSPNSHLFYQIKEEIAESSAQLKGQGRYQCKICEMHFSEETDLTEHINEKTRNRAFACCACGKKFRDNTQLMVHERIHTGEKPYECKECGKKFSINGNLSKHLRTHTGDRRFQCELCERKFTQLVHLNDHVKIHSGNVILKTASKLF